MKSAWTTLRKLLTRSRRHDPDHAVRPDDVCLVAYPKSGITWLRFLIGNYLTDGHCDFANSHLIVPDLHLNPRTLRELTGPRFVKSHEPWRPAYRRVVYLVRDARDVAVSYYFYQKRMRMIPPDTSFADFLDRFHQGTADRYGRWCDHVTGWLDHGPADLLLLRYEQLRANPAAGLTRVLEKGGLKPDPAKIARAVEASCLSNMQRLEQAQEAQIQALIPRVNFDREIPFVRSGKVGSAAEHYDAPMLEAFQRVHGEAMRRLNDLSADPAETVRHAA